MARELKKCWDVLMNHRNTELYEKYGKDILRSSQQYSTLMETVSIVYFLTGTIKRKIKVDL